MALTEDEAVAIRNSYFNPKGFWSGGGYDAGTKTWFLIRASDKSYHSHSEASVKEQFLDYNMRDLQEQFTTVKQMEVWGITKPHISEIPEYPKDIKRGSYSITVENAEQEKQAKDFLGIEPAGDDMDTWLSKRDLTGLEQWKSYWTNIFSNIGMSFWINFINEKFDEYKDKLIITPDEETTLYWQNKGYSLDDAFLLADWVRVNKRIPTQEEINGILGIEPELSWWEKMLLKITEVIPGMEGIKFDPLKAIVEKVTGVELTEKQWLDEQAKILEWMTPFNVLSKLMFGKNLKGETEEFGSSGDWIELMIYGVGMIIPGNVDEIAAKTALKTLSKKEAAALTAKMGVKATVNELIKTVKLYPTSSAKLLAKFPKTVTDAVFAGLYKTAWGREAVYTLGKTGFYKYSAPVWKQVITSIMKWSAPVIAITLPIFAITEIPNLFNMIQFARKQKLQAVGDWPSDIAFQLDTYENLMKDYAYNIDKKIIAEDKISADDLLKKLMEVIETYRNYIDDKKDVMLPENYDLSLLTLEFYETFVSDRMGKIDKLPEEVPPEVTTGTLILSVEPSDAEIEVAGQPEIKAAGTFILNPGSYVIKASKDNYWDKSSTAIIKEGEETETSITLTKLSEPEPELPPEEVRGTLTISVTPEDALIEVAGNEEITTAGTYELLPGSYSIRASAEGFVTDIKTAYVSDMKDTAVSFILESTEPTPTPISKATITITSEPTDAQIYIDGEYQWTTTPYTILLDKGSYWIRVQKQDYYPIEIEAEVEEGEVAEIPFVLERIPEPEVPEEPYIPQTPYYPTYEPTEVYTPAVVTTPTYEYPSYNYDNLWPEIMTIPEVESVTPSTEKELLINIETTDLLPWLGRIYSIAFLDLSNPDAEIQVAILNDEATLINGFIDFFETGGYTKLTGYNIAFDFRYIFAKMMKYRRPSKVFKNVELRDIMQIMKQVQEAFVFGFNKPGKLDEWGKFLLGRGKYGSQDLMLNKFISGDFDYCRAFQVRQIELSFDIYNLARFCMGEAFISSPSPVSAPIEAISETISAETPAIQGNKTCPNCKAFNPLSATTCEICSVAI